MRGDTTLRLEEFIQAVQSQLDKAQAAMALKARNLNLPLTFAIKDINLDLRAHVDFSESEVYIRPASAADTSASVFHLVFTAITRPAIEENAIALADDPEDQSLDELGEDLTQEDRRKLEWMGVRSVGKLQEMEEQGRIGTIGRVTNLPVDRLKKALERASTPLVNQVIPVRPTPGDDPDLPALLRVTGRNLVRKGTFPQVNIGNRPVAVIKSSANELLIAPDADQWAGQLSVEAAPQLAAAMSFDLTPFAPKPARVADPENVEAWQ